MPALRYTNPQGGLYVWVELPPGAKTGVNGRLFRQALDSGVLYVPGEMCYCADPARRIPQNCMRLSFGAVPVPQIRRGIQLLAQALQA